MSSSHQLTLTTPLHSTSSLVSATTTPHHDHDYDHHRDHPHDHPYTTALQSLETDYPWIRAATTATELATHIRSKLQFAEEMLKMVSTNCTLQTGMPHVEQECRERMQAHCAHLATMTNTHIQAHRQDMDRVREQLVTQVVSDQAQQRTHLEHERVLSTQTRQGITQLADQVTLATQHLQEATSQWKSSMSVGAHKGAMGEREVMEALKMHFGTMSVVHTGNTPESGDIHLLHTEQDPALGDVLVEVKCYLAATASSSSTSSSSFSSSSSSSSSARVVPLHEVHKFEHDVDRCKLPLAVLGALGTGIRSKGAMQLDQRNGTLLLYLPNTTPAGIVTGVLALQLLHTWRVAMGRATTPPTTTTATTTPPDGVPAAPTDAIAPTGAPTHVPDTTQAYHQLLLHLRPVMRDIEQELEHNTFFADMLKELQELDSLRRRMKSRVEEHKTRLTEVSRRARQMLQEELQDAAQLVMHDAQAHVPPATTPDTRRTLMDRAMTAQNQSESTQQKHNVVVAMFLEWLDAHQMGVRESQGGLLVLTREEVPHAFLEVKKTKVVLRDLEKTWTVHLTNEGVGRVEGVLGCLL